MNISRSPTRRRLLVNTVTATIQSFFSGLCLFVLYRQLLHHVGIAEIGLWSLTATMLSLANLASLGLPSAVTKVGAELHADGDAVQAGQVLTTAVIVVAVMTGLALVLLVALLILYPGILGSAERVRPMIPVLALSTLMGVVGSTFRSGLDAAQRSDLRNCIVAGQTLTYLVLSLIMVRQWGLMGVIWAQCIATGLSMLVSAGFASILHGHVLTRPRWNALSRMMGFGATFQIINISCQLYEPSVKWIMAAGAGLELVGWYEMSSRMIYQFRDLLTSAQEGLFPYMSALNRLRPEEADRVYGEISRLNSALAATLFTALAAGMPVISSMWIGSVSAPFIITSSILLAGAWFNVLALPAYFSGQGTGLLTWNAWAHVLILMLFILTGLPSARLGGFFGVVAAWTICHSIGCAIIVWGFHRQRKLPLLALVDAGRWMRYTVMAFISIIPIVLSLIHSQETWVIWLSASVAILLMGMSLRDPGVITVFRLFLSRFGIHTAMTVLPVARPGKIL